MKEKQMPDIIILSSRFWMSKKYGQILQSNSQYKNEQDLLNMQ